MSAAGLDALLFAAGLGTRLRPLTDRLPKALVPVAGVPALERAARHVVDAGIDQLVINIHHHAAQIEAFVRRRHGFGVAVHFSREAERPLETGGGLLQAAPLLRRSGPIVLRNTDVVTDAPLAPMLEAHGAAGALATLAVNVRAASRYLRFDEHGLQGHRDARTGSIREARPAQGPVRELAFCGIHVVAPELLERITERGVFSITEVYLRLAAEGERILPHDLGAALWFDIGSADRLRAAEQALRAAERRGLR